ncbi:MAG: nuclease-related domain-containing protein [Anaerolineae bacterium]|nr:nuclease-related domain-containing protein [Anaerolineae bacterium]
MKAITNTDIIESRSKWAKRVAPLTMAFLFGGLLVNFYSFSRPEYFQLAVIMIGVGFFLSLISSSLVNNWVKEPRSDQALSATLRKFGNDYILFNYTSSLAPHILLTPARLYVVITRRHSGRIQVNGQRFSRKLSFVRLLRYFADEGLGVPFKEAQGQIYKLHKLLADHLPDGTVPDIEGLVIFTNKEVDLVVNEPVMPVLTASELKLYLREHDKAKSISAQTRAKLIELLGNGYPPITSKK